MKNQIKGCITAALVAVLLFAVAVSVGICLSPSRSKTAAVPLSGYWTPDSAPAQELRDYVARITDPDGITIAEQQYRPVEAQEELAPAA